VSRSRNPRTHRVALTALGVVAATSTLAGCGADLSNGALPSDPEVTNQTGRIIDLWNGSWIAALVVGVITWGLILWAATVYRKRKGDNKMPVQTRVNLPLELMYTIVPLIMIAVLFSYTARDIAAITDTSEPADVHIQVIGKQWSWDFNYLDEDVHIAGVQADLTGEEGVRDQLPTLYIPVGERIEFTVDSRDVIHSFWIPAFLYKMDAIPGRTNTFQVIPGKIGHYDGKCAELCGEYHAAMLFNVAVVSRADYDAYIQSLRDAGQTGLIGLEYNREQDVTTEATP
jgi:cytochrome c oxidase subunit 2